MTRFTTNAAAAFVGSVAETICVVVDVVIAGAMILVLLAATLTLRLSSLDKITEIDAITTTTIAMAKAATRSVVSMLLTNIVAAFAMAMACVLIVSIAAVAGLAACVTRVCWRSDLLPCLDAKHQVGCKAGKVS